MNYYFIHIPKSSGSTMIGEKSVISGPHQFNVPGVYRLCDKERGFAKYPTNYYLQYRYTCTPNKKISIIRNPFDMLWSYYRHGCPLNEDGTYCHSGWAAVNYTYQFKSFKEFLTHYCDETMEWHVPALKDYLYSQLFNEKGDCVADYIIKFEHRYQGIKELNNKLNINLPTHKCNASRDQTSYKDVYDDEMRGMVQRKCKRELEDFGYTFDGPINDNPVIYNCKVKHHVKKR